MFEPKRASQAPLVHYIGSRITEEEEAWLCLEMEARKLTMSDLLRLALYNLKNNPPLAKVTE